MGKGKSDTKKEGMRQVSTRAAIPFVGGAITRRPPGLLESGQFSMIQDLRPRHPGFVKRKGMAAFCSQADGTLRVENLYQFSKGKRTERHFFAQYSDGDLRAASADPPATITGGFGNEVYSGNTSPKPMAMSHTNDVLVMSNGVDQHQLFAGDENYVSAFFKFAGSAAPPKIPEEGFDYTIDVVDGQTNSSADLGSLQRDNEFNYLYVCSPIPANRLKFTMSQVNATAATMTLKYRKSDDTWADSSATDGTDNGGATFGQTGAVTWAYPSDEIPHYMFGRSGFWYQIDVSSTLDATVTCTGVEYGTTGDQSGGTYFTALRNIWDGAAPYAVEVRKFLNTSSVYYTYSADSVELDSMTSSDKVYFNAADKIKGFYVDVGETPNTTSSTTINSVYYWDGDSWVVCTNVNDGTNGLANSGWVTFDHVTSQQKVQFQGAQYFSYWYYFTVDQTLSSDVIAQITYMPFFNITEAGAFGWSSIAWKDRMVYSFGNQYIYISADRNPMVLNGDDFAILQAGDGRANKVVCMRRFHNEIMVWQEEKGVDGGCLTLFEGYNPATFGKLVLSTRVGTFNNKSAVVVDGVLTSTASDETLKTLAFFLSHYGVCATDGRTVTIISDDIQDYFDPTDSNCIRRGYENQMWLDFDSSGPGLRAGLVTGSTATECNTFLYYDLIDKVWMFDSPAQELSCHAEIEGASGAVDRLQYGGGIDDGLVYRLNTGTADVSNQIDSYAKMELNYRGYWMLVRNLYLQIKAQTGNVTITPYRNEIAGTVITLSQVAEVTNQTIRRHNIGLGLQDAHVSLKFQNASATTDMYLQKMGVEVYVKESH